MISDSKSAIFRQEALEIYIRSREKAVLPSFVAPPVIFFFWCLLTIFLSIDTFAWFGQVPIYTTGTGTVADVGKKGAEAVIFVPYTPALHVRRGQPLQLQIGDVRVSGRVKTVNSRQFSPLEVRQRYQVAVSGPSVMITTHLRSRFSWRAYAGSAVVAQVQVGTRRLISFLPGFAALVKDVQ